jgi:hypothetical protein
MAGRERQVLVLAVPLEERAVREIEIVLDVRPSPDTPELILVKQKLAAEGNHLKLVGEPHEQRVAMGGPRLVIKFAERADNEVGYVLTAHVTNVGMSPVEISSVAIVFPPEKSGPEKTRKQGTRRYLYKPLEPVRGPLFPGHTRTYYLPMELYDVVVYNARKLPPSGYWVAAFIGEEDVARCGGEDLGPYLNQSRIEYDRRAEIALDSLPEGETFLILKGLFEFAAQNYSMWKDGEIQQLDPAKKLYLVKVTPKYRAVVTRLAEDKVLLTDVVSEESLKQYKTAEATGSRQG